MLEQYRLPDALDIDAPALLLTGIECLSHLRESVRAVDDLLWDRWLVEFKRVGYFGLMEERDSIAAEIRAFVSEA